MATRSGGRSDERSNARGASGRGNTSRSGTNASGTSEATRGATSNRGGSTSAGTNSASGQSATRGQSATSGQGATRAQSAIPGSGSQTASGRTGVDATRQETTERQNATRQSVGGPQGATSTRVGGGSGTISNAGASASASPTRGDQEREVRTAREQGNMRPGASSQQRANPIRQASDYLSSMRGPMGGSTPFAMMRRMMDDMDRLFSEYGFTHPGILASNLLSPEIWGSPRALGGGSSAGSSVSPAQSRGQPGLQRGGQRGLQQSGMGGLWAPQVEVFERGNNLVVRAELPGLTREDVDVELDDDALIIRGERHSDVEDEQEGFYRSERSYGSFYRAIPLPENIDHSACNATFREGVLEVTLPKPAQQQSRARRIDVR